MKKYILQLWILLLLLAVCSGCSQSNMTIIDQNGKQINVFSDGADTYTFKLPSSQQKPTIGWDNPFIDVSETAWYTNAVRYCNENALMQGTAENTFSPELSTNRGMIVSILWRLEGCPIAVENTFIDVPAEQYYADAVSWAASENIVSGYNQESFVPEAPITREQLASILYRYAAYKGWDTTQSISLEEYHDNTLISPYAQNAFSWAAAQGIINGTDDHLLQPHGTATRAQVAVILMNVCEYAVK